MNDGNQMMTPVLQDWWERYVCPSCMSKERTGAGLCANEWHAVPAVLYECAASAFSPLSIPVADLQQAGLLGARHVAMYGFTWTRSRPRPQRPPVLGFV
ncbi:hypothetical protein [Naasia sp. SYSU D00057]|uniref:hypothetical protein n=1 Tax=Naasia sp. SYSU D00057 TaxID=2817380 RepID=UPI001B30AFBE|nr:hypothetical protein [Naasia sp. SYSU D00057]